MAHTDTHTAEAAYLRLAGGDHIRWGGQDEPAVITESVEPFGDREVAVTYQIGGCRDRVIFGRYDQIEYCGPSAADARYRERRG